MRPLIYRYRSTHISQSFFLFNLLLRVEFYYISEAISLIIFQSQNMKESYDEHSSMKFCKGYNCNYNYFSGFLMIITGWVNKQKNIQKSILGLANFYMIHFICLWLSAKKSHHVLSKPYDISLKIFVSLPTNSSQLIKIGTQVHLSFLKVVLRSSYVLTTIYKHATVIHSYSYNYNTL